MSSTDVVMKASNRAFCQRVAYIAMRVAHQKAKTSPDDLNAMVYAEHIFRGGENATLLALHVAAANEAVSAVLETELPEMVRDADIEAALQDIWAMRSAAFGATNMQVRKTRELVDMVTKSAEEAQAAVAQARSMMQVDGNTLGTKPKSKSGA